MKKRALLGSAIVLGIGSLANAQVYNGAGFAIPDNNVNGGSSNIVVTDSGNVEAGIKVSITFSPEHTWAGDLIATLSHDDGSTTVTADLFRRMGKLSSSGTDYGRQDDLNGTYNLSDTFGTSFWSAPATTGNIAPGDYRAFTNTFNGSPGAWVSLDSIFGGRTLAGTWTLKIVDSANGDNGSVSAWSITNTPVPAPGALALLGLAGLASARRRRIA